MEEVISSKLSGELNQSAETVATEETMIINEKTIRESRSDLHEKSAHSVALTQSSEAHINMPIKKDSVLNLLMLSEAAATEESTDLSESKANECMSDAASCTEHIMEVTQICVTSIICSVHEAPQVDLWGLHKHAN